MLPKVFGFYCGVRTVNTQMTQLPQNEWLSGIPAMLVCAALVLASSLEGQESSRSGRLIVGSLPADYGLLANDTLREIRWREVPTEAQAIVVERLREWNYELDCTRVFLHAEAIVFVLGRDCGKGDIPRDDGSEGFLVTSMHGVPHGIPRLSRYLAPDAFFLEPLFRDREEWCDP